MTTILWMPEGNPSVTRLGLVEVKPGREVTLWDHEALVGWRLQELIEQEQVTKRGLEQMVRDTLIAEGWTVSISSLESAGMDIVAGIAGKLRADGALTLEGVTVPLEDDPDLRELFEEMTLESWLNRASMPPL
ncbi:hypothetical protein D3870_08150 [Noviherbaspirillum cavernae]|uniref:Uncharacterized protein n=1 Tax=Noviherbaspirillum cavernae TaxID=2320862 RepID=A0A418X0M3_9BURK|nr:hypothetical protein [Noviherbaspirillum cavernae]RJG05991.1 hypothetical protein D3870_08150 [Noviherbaspirillum cavernae]